MAEGRQKKASTRRELAGYALFKNSGCVACHNGPAVGGTSFQKMGVVEPRKATSPAEGRPRSPAGRRPLQLQVPTLRNVELTYPYFHDGEAATLEKGRRRRGRLQLGKRFTTEENASIVAFLKTLTGSSPASTGRRPQLHAQLQAAPPGMRRRRSQRGRPIRIHAARRTVCDHSGKGQWYFLRLY